MHVEAVDQRALLVNQRGEASSIHIAGLTDPAPAPGTAAARLWHRRRQRRLRGKDELRLVSPKLQTQFAHPIHSGGSELPFNGRNRRMI